MSDGEGTILDSVCRVIPLSDDWLAVVRSDGRITLQHVSHAVMTGTGSVVNLSEIARKGGLPQRHIEELEDGRLVLRALDLHPDGSVFVEPGGISSNGEVGSEGFAILCDTVTAASRFLATLSQRQAGDIF